MLRIRHRIGTRTSYEQHIPVGNHPVEVLWNVNADTLIRRSR